MKKSIVFIITFFVFSNIVFGEKYCGYDDHSNYRCEYYEELCFDPPVPVNAAYYRGNQYCVKAKSSGSNKSHLEKLMDEISAIKEQIAKCGSRTSALCSNIKVELVLKEKQLNDYLGITNYQNSETSLPSKNLSNNGNLNTKSDSDGINPGMYKNNQIIDNSSTNDLNEQQNYLEKNETMNNCSTPGICNNIKTGQNPYIKDGEYEKAYNWAYEYSITTMDTLTGANIYGNITRSEFAKMISNFAINVLGIKKDESKNCSFTDGNIGGDLQEAIINSCELGLMGQGIKQFNPNGYITKGEVATILDRLINPDNQKICNPFYKCSYEELNNQAILTSEGSEVSNEKRGNIFIMLNRACRNTSFPVPYKNKRNVCDWWVMDSNEYKYYSKNLENIKGNDISDTKDKTSGGIVSTSNISNNTVSNNNDNNLEICSDPSVKLACSMNATSCPEICQ